jgi:hypothetical protein
MIPVKITSSDYVYKGEKLPAINCSASIDSTGKMHISLCNIDPDISENVDLNLESFEADKISGKVLTAGKMNALNTFESPDVVKPAAFNSFNLKDNNLKVDMPPMSVVVLELEGKVKMKSHSIELKNPKQGINYKYYEESFGRLPDFSGLTPKSSGSVDKFVLPDVVRDANFALKYKGYIKIPEDGLYTFYTTSDDGTVILIDGKLVVNNDGQHAMQEESGNIMLNTGYHKIELLFFQGGGGMGLSASIEGPQMGKQIIPKDMLFREE